MAAYRKTTSSLDSVLRGTNETLKDHVNRKSETLDIDKCVRGIRSGIEHLHSLGYCHNDINPSNIMFKSRDVDTPVIIHFDSCVRTGDPLGVKTGTPFFSHDDARHSAPENDINILRLVEEYLRKTESGM